MLDFQSFPQRWTDTFAYWIGVVNEPGSSALADVREVRARMNYQYESEEQATAADYVWAADANEPDYPLVQAFHPVAPVTLARQWMPFPTATAALGEPVLLERYRDFVLTVYQPVSAPAFAATTPDERHFLQLLTAACQRALAMNHYVLLAGAPGYAYEEALSISRFPGAQRAMQQAGFASWDRFPADAVFRNPHASQPE